MRQISDFPYTYEEIENIRIPVSEGISLSARFWKPHTGNEKIPAIIEYIPYRKRDIKRIRDEGIHRYFAGHGYACLRVDIRGSGDSEGVLTDEYLEQELQDGEEIIRWVRNQEWSNGKAGMIGISWGGFNGLQLAARRPEGLEAIISVCSSDDRYLDDVHYMGGCLLGDNLSWASVMFRKNSYPPDPEIVGNKWKDMWLDRLENSGLWLVKWLQHQQRDQYWKRGSVSENYSDIKIPVMAVSGWADGYTNTVFRLMKNLTSPGMALVGPWSHKYPHLGEPGPAIGFLQESLRWWDQWLKGQDTGIMDEYRLRLWMQKSVPPGTSYENRPGYWLGLDDWPSGNVENKIFYINKNELLEQAEQINPEKLDIHSPLRLGLFAGKWCSYSAPPDLPGDQREEDGGAEVFTSKPLKEELEIVGAPLADIRFESNKKIAMIAVRISDVMTDGKATRVTYGIKNLTHLKNHEQPEYLEKDRKYRVKVQMNDIAHVFPKGHKIRISVSTSYWPLAWPPPENATVSIFTGESSVQLPVLKKRNKKPITFLPAEEAEPGSTKYTTDSSNYRWDVIRDLISDKSTLVVEKDQGTYKLEDIDLEISEYIREEYSVFNDHVDSVKGETFGDTTLKRGNWTVRTKDHTVLTSDKHNFYVHATLDGYESGKRVFSKIWDKVIPRRFV